MSSTGQGHRERHKTGLVRPACKSGWRRRPNPVSAPRVAPPTPQVNPPSRAWNMIYQSFWQDHVSSTHFSYELDHYYEKSYFDLRRPFYKCPINNRLQVQTEWPSACLQREEKVLVQHITMHSFPGPRGPDIQKHRRDDRANYAHRNFQPQNFLGGKEIQCAI